MGRPKQLLDLAGKPVLQHVVDAAAASTVDRIVVVLGHAADEVQAVLRLPPNGEIALNPEHQQGQGTSLRVGLGVVDPGAGALVVLLGDQPGIRPEAIDAVVEAWREGRGPIVQAAYGGHPGHPTLFDRSIWPRLESVQGDEGARRLLAQRRDVTMVELGGVPPDDIDTEDDYVRIKATYR